MTVTTHEPDPDDAAYTPSAAVEQELQGSEDSALDASKPERPDNVTTLAKMNGSPPSPDDTTAAAGERADVVTVLARMNDTPPGRQDSEKPTEETEPVPGRPSRRRAQLPQ